MCHPKVTPPTRKFVSSPSGRTLLQILCGLWHTK
jgi:hypothetical protein